MDSNKRPAETNLLLQEPDPDELSFEEADQIAGAACETQLFEF